MSARWLIAFSALIVAGVGVILLVASPPSHVVIQWSDDRMADASSSVAQGRGATAEGADAGETVKVSALELDFGNVPILFPSRESFYLVNHGRVPVGVRGVSLEGPFRAETTIAQLDPKVATKFTVTFDPKEPGLYTQRLLLTLDSGKGLQEVDVILRGQAVLSPQAAGIAIPPPPDQVLRTYQAEKAAREIAQYDESTRMQQVSLEEEFPKVVDLAGGFEPLVTNEGAASPGAAAARGFDAGFRGLAIASLGAFGEENGGQDLNDIPVPVTGGEKKPDLPPGNGDDDDEGDPSNPSGGDSDEEADGDAGGGDPGDDTEDSGDHDDPGDEEQSKKDDDHGAGLFTIAPNSSVVVYSNRGPLPLQSHTLTFTSGSALRINGRLTLPEVGLAFGEFITLEQFGPITGTLSQDGSVVMNMTLRVHDSGGFVDLPVQLTTGMTAGYSAAGRLFFDSGIRRDPVTGNVKMVGIANVPMGKGSMIEKAPVYFEVLGRIQL